MDDQRPTTEPVKLATVDGQTIADPAQAKPVRQYRGNYARKLARQLKREARDDPELQARIARQREAAKAKEAAKRAKVTAAARRSRAATWKPSQKELRTIECAMAAGLSVEQAARSIGHCSKLVHERCADAIENGRDRCNAAVVEKLFRSCMKGNTIALMFWCKARLGWQERQRVEHTGGGGGAIKVEKVEAEANAFTQRILAMAERFAEVPAANDTDDVPDAAQSAETAS
jgi:hypothetical protein